ncbi:Hsp20/alpha crystallin family protein [uncultured Thiohalocapsa sp.]|uniref:Hsp20/alpha crystallin family protein n=1 Tax=uncultured Thiohalocapsa sp. TaxID=768990 RepID=UPI0025D43E4D|nr:Hsp20/alpha crystallin family protein [uncultured Thiohalocapsa sp.]
MNPRWSLFATACLLLPALAQAGNGGPAAGQASPQSMPPAGLPIQPPPMAPMPGLPPSMRGAGPELSAGGGPMPPPMPPAYDPETGRLAFDFAGIRLTQSRGDDAYLLDIDLRGLPAAQVQIRAVGGGLLLAVRRSAETTREETFADGRGYRRSWGFSTGQRVRRLPAPPDADLRNLQRTDGDDTIRIRMPRRSDLPEYGQPTPQTLPPAPREQPQ